MILEGCSLKIGDVLDVIKFDVKWCRKLICYICFCDYF